MKLDRVAHEVQALKTIKSRWQLRKWKFTPLEGIDGENETLDSIYALRDSPLCWLEIDNSPLSESNERLLDELEELYLLAAQPWEQFRTLYDPDASQRERLRWPYGTFPARIRQEARDRFWELVTTTRFSVNATPSIFSLQQVNWLRPPLTVRHAASLAAMVCIKNGIQALELVLSSWRTESRAYKAGKPFEWLLGNDPEQLRRIVLQVLEIRAEKEFYSKKIGCAWADRKQAEAWLSQLNTLDYHDEVVEKTRALVKAQTTSEINSLQSSRARQAASAPRKGRSAKVTMQAVAEYFMARPGQKHEVLIYELATAYGVSESTVSRRRRDAVKANLLS